MKNVEINPDRILAAAKKCSTADTVLRTLFPEVFKEAEERHKTIHFKLTKLGTGPENKIIIPAEKLKEIGLPQSTLQVRASGNLGGISFYLPWDVKWEIKEDEGGNSCLVPTKRNP